MKDWIERRGPYVLAFIIAGIYLYFFRQVAVPANIKNLFATIVSICAVSIGFLATTESILFSIHDRKIIEWIKNAGLYNDLVNYLMSAIHLCFLWAILSALGIILDPNDLLCWYQWMIGLWLFLGSAAIISCYRVIYLFSKILRHD